MSLAAAFFNPNDRLRPGPFVLGALLVYALGAASHLLTASDVMTHASLWPFAGAQAVLIWAWYGLHARRLRDAGRSAGLAAGVALLYVLSIVLLLILALAFGSSVGSLGYANATVGLGLILVVYVLATLSAASGDGLGWAMIAVLTAMAFLPVVIALIFTVWTAVQPSAAKAA